MSSPGPPAYPYRQLQSHSIRVLTVYPGTEQNGVVCGLEEVNIQRLPPYEALSYCWGDPNDRLPIQCNGLPFRVTKSLHSALVRLRLPDQPRRIWADAICINQDDTAERSSQVLLMQTIYRGAVSVVVWLGGPVEVNGQDLWPIPHLLEAAQKNLKRTQLPIKHGTKDWVKFVLSNDWTTNGDLQDKKWNAIIKSLIMMLQRPWFLRTWIIQEVALARSAVVLCGRHESSWDDFYRAVGYAIDVDYFSNTAPEMYSSIRQIEKTRRDIFTRGHVQRPLDLLSNFRVFLATDARDKVFGLYSLFSPSDRAVVELAPNYDMDVASVFTRAAVDCIAVEGNLDILSFATRGEEYESLPSWVPDWTFQDRAQPLLPRFLLNQSFGDHSWPASWVSATGSTYPVVELSKDSKRISLMGCIVDRVVAIGGVLHKTYLQEDPGHAMTEHAEMLKEGNEVFQSWGALCGIPENRAYFTGETAYDVFWKTMHAGTYPYGDEQKTKTAFEKWYRPFKDMQDIEACAEEGAKVWNDDDVGVIHATASTVKWIGKLTYKGMRMGFGMWRAPNQTRMAAVHRLMLRTERGYVGLASANVEEGDYVALFQGCKLPLILREATEDSWNLISDAYIHGIMDGRLFETLPCIMLDLE
ncbi:heterokaryon incompatibility protein-domain-containing protein [Stachybotrys elegans]|uniref:Heterokaryon incompatibility protein-domain-containing protein n=1 Tax=Stachybotrys elegans TaxID=80388 RepID=A0A8K0WSY6_9HYPO|nr:heterokaryon incompatibility protein-domain-containing protein [Stachybotrys elegans]